QGTSRRLSPMADVDPVPAALPVDDQRAGGATYLHDVLPRAAVERGHEAGARVHDGEGVPAAAAIDHQGPHFAEVERDGDGDETADLPGCPVGGAQSAVG